MHSHRYDKIPNSYLAGLHLSASMIWLKGLARTLDHNSIRALVAAQHAVTAHRVGW